jgi:hypothetical protein
MPALKWILGLCVCLLAASCEESEKERLSRLVKEWEGKEILFPAHSTFTIQGKDTVDFEFRNAEYKIVTYIDSVGCTSCKLQLSRWKEFMTEVDGLANGSIPFLFYFHPKDMRELRYLTRKDAFIHPVCFDEKDELNRLNQLPADMIFQTFLLDKDNKVVAMGNPVLNPQIKELYLNVIIGRTKGQQTSSITSVSINQTTIDFGSFPQSDIQEGSFILTNMGNSLLVIQDIITSCGCTKVEYSKEPIRSGDTLKVKVIYEAEQAEYINKRITIYCNTEDSPLRLTIKGTAR